MNRRIIDLLLSWTGLVVAVVLLVAGGLLLYGSSFVKDQVHDQLATQKIFFPPANSDAVKGPQFAAMPVRRPAAPDGAAGGDLRQPLHRRASQ